MLCDHPAVLGSLRRGTFQAVGPCRPAVTLGVARVTPSFQASPRARSGQRGGREGKKKASWSFPHGSREDHMQPIHDGPPRRPSRCSGRGMVRGRLCWLRLYLWPRVVWGPATGQVPWHSPRSRKTAGEVACLRLRLIPGRGGGAPTSCRTTARREETANCWATAGHMGGLVSTRQSHVYLLFGWQAGAEYRASARVAGWSHRQVSFA